MKQNKVNKWLYKPIALEKNRTIRLMNSLNNYKVICDHHKVKGNHCIHGKSHKRIYECKMHYCINVNGLRECKNEF